MSAGALKSAGASEVVSEAVELGLQMASFALTAAGMPIGVADFQVDRQREELRAEIDVPLKTPRSECEKYNDGQCFAEPEFAALHS